MLDPRFHDVDELIAEVTPAVIDWTQLNHIGSSIQRAVRSSATIEDYALALWNASDNPARAGVQLDGIDMDRLILAGASPRGMSAMLRAARVVAWLDGRTHLEPDDVRAVLPSALGHRIFFTPVYELRRAELAVQLMHGIMNRVAAP